jgi:ribosomal protein S18 acetylase RimI-like enzyme
MNIRLFEQNNKILFCQLFSMLYDARNLLFYRSGPSNNAGFDYEVRQTIVKLLLGLTHVNDKPIASLTAAYIRDNRVLGCVTFVPQLQLIELLVTSPQFRGQGVGTSLINYAIAQLNEYGAKHNITRKIGINVLSSNLQTHHLYKKMGFVQTRLQAIEQGNANVVIMHLNALGAS